MYYTQRLKKPDTFCLLLTRKAQILEQNGNAYFNNKTLKVFSKKLHLLNIEWNVTTSKITFPSLFSRRCMSSLIFKKTFSCLVCTYIGLTPI